MKDKILVRDDQACENMAIATTICLDTSFLTGTKTILAAATMGRHVQLGKRTERGTTLTKNNQVHSSVTTPNASGIDIVGPVQFVSELGAEPKTLLAESIFINSRAFEEDQEGQMTFVGSRSEKALLEFARTHLGIGPLQVERSNANIISATQEIQLPHGHSLTVTIIQRGDGTFRAYVKGAPEILLPKCTKIIDDVSTVKFSESFLGTEDSDFFTDITSAYASRALETVALLYKDFDYWPPTTASSEVDPKLENFSVIEGMTLVGIFGIKYHLRQGMFDAVKCFQNAGIFVRLVTSENIYIAKAIAEECGIYNSGNLVMEGSTFRKLSREERRPLAPRLQVLAWSSLLDTQALVRDLQVFGGTVAVASGNSDILRQGDIGVSMGITGTDIAKVASSIVILDDEFSSIVKALLWARAYREGLQKFLQVSEFIQRR